MAEPDSERGGIHWKTRLRKSLCSLTFLSFFIQISMVLIVVSVVCLAYTRGQDDVIECQHCIFSVNNPSHNARCKENPPRTTSHACGQKTKIYESATSATPNVLNISGHGTDNIQDSNWTQVDKMQWRCAKTVGILNGTFTIIRGCDLVPPSITIQDPIFNASSTPPNITIESHFGAVKTAQQFYCSHNLCNGAFSGKKMKHFWVPWLVASGTTLFVFS